MHSILNYIIRHTNKYGEYRCNEWSITYCSNIINLICVLFLSYIQNRKYKPSNWLSNYLLLDNPMTKTLLQETSFIEFFGIFLFSLFLISHHQIMRNNSPLTRFKSLNIILTTDLINYSFQ